MQAQFCLRSLQRRIKPYIEKKGQMNRQVLEKAEGHEIRVLTKDG